MKVLFVFLFLIMFAGNAKAIPVIKVGCSLYDEKGVLIKLFPGHFCEYLESGNRVTFSVDRLMMYDAKDNLVWQNPGFYHHRIAFDLPRKEVIALMDSGHDVLGCLTRFDAIMIYDINTGKLKKTVDFYDLFKDKVISSALDITFLTKMNVRSRPQYLCDTTHVNSVSQIPKNILETKNKAFSAGNWIVNASFTGTVLVFDREFTKVLWQATMPLDLPFTHDVQFTPEGKILIYVNSYLKPGSKRTVVSAVAEIDPDRLNKKDLKIVELKMNGENTYQDITGGVQYLSDGRKLVSLFSPKEGYQAAFMDKNWKIIRKFAPYPSPSKKSGQNFQEAKLIELNNFFRNYQGQF